MLVVSFGDMPGATIFDLFLPTRYSFAATRIDCNSVEVTSSGVTKRSFLEPFGFIRIATPSFLSVFAEDSLVDRDCSWVPSFAVSPNKSKATFSDWFDLLSIGTSSDSSSFIITG